jgi:hypothetical protein
LLDSAFTQVSLPAEPVRELRGISPFTKRLGELCFAGLSILEPDSKEANLYWSRPVSSKVLDDPAHKWLLASTLDSLNTNKMHDSAPLRTEVSSFRNPRKECDSRNLEVLDEEYLDSEVVGTASVTALRFKVLNLLRRFVTPEASLSINLFFFFPLRFLKNGRSC